MKTRKEIAEGLGEFLHGVGLNEVYGVLDVNEGKCRSLNFCKASILDGQVRVFSPRFIQVKWQTAIRSLPSRGSFVFENEDHAKDFIFRAFVDFDTEGAMKVPRK